MKRLPYAVSSNAAANRIEVAYALVKLVTDLLPVQRGARGREFVSRFSHAQTALIKPSHACRGEMLLDRIQFLTEGKALE